MRVAGIVVGAVLLLACCGAGAAHSATGWTTADVQGFRNRCYAKPGAALEQELGASGAEYTPTDAEWDADCDCRLGQLKLNDVPAEEYFKHPDVTAGDFHACYVTMGAKH